MGAEHLANADLFWSYVAKAGPDDCWLWTGAIYTPRGYGAFNIKRKVHYAHRIAWALMNGPIPPGVKIRHRCDNPPCCNPRDLLAGSQTDNMQDARIRGRLNTPDRRGAANGRAKLTEQDVRTIRERAATGASNSALAREYGLTETAVRYIVIRRNWSHVE